MKAKTPKKQGDYSGTHKDELTLSSCSSIKTSTPKKKQTVKEKTKLNLPDPVVHR